MKYLGIDWGMKRIGLAISEGELASPFSAVEIHSLEDGVNKVLEIIKKEGVDQAIIGKPEGEMGKAVGKVVNAFAGRGVPLIEVDETLSTHDAKGLMLEIGLSQKDRKEDNAVAAAIILQRFLDEKEK